MYSVYGSDIEKWFETIDTEIYAFEDCNWVCQKYKDDCEISSDTILIDPCMQYVIYSLEGKIYDIRSGDTVTVQDSILDYLGIW